MEISEKTVMPGDSDLFKQGMQHYHNRDLTAAEKTFREILTENSHHADSLHMMAVMGFEVGRYDTAEQLARMALEEEKKSEFYFTLGSILNAQKKFEDALFSYQEAIKLRPDHFKALLAMAHICRDQGMIFRKKDMIDAALTFFNRALAIHAEEDIYYNIAYIHQQQAEYAQAIAVCEACLKRHPDSVRCRVSLASIYNFVQLYKEALEHYKEALKLDPENGDVYGNMAGTMKNLGYVDDAIEATKKALRLLPDRSWVHDSLLFTMIYAASVSPAELAAQSKFYGECITDHLRRDRPFTNDRDPHRKLRIGYVSGDFRSHAVHYFLSPIYRSDKKNFEIYAYSNNEIDDEITTKMKAHFDHWRDIKFASDDIAADMIEKDKIDILVDLAGHTARNNLKVFARKPAPIQVTWLGYPATTGMKAMDYRITDPHAEPLGMTEHLNTEALWRMPDIFCVYTAHANSPSVIDHPPHEDNGYITFGCFNNFTKVSDPVLTAWAKIMSLVPHSRLLLEIAGIKNQKIKTEVEERLARFGLPMDRLILEPRDRANQFVLYNKIDIALDPFPCAGGTTSMDTLYMGVPFVTLAGRHFVSRMGVTLLTNVGLPELIAQTSNEYVSIAVNLATDPAELGRARSNLRERTMTSPLMDQERFARNMENAFREMWKKWLREEANV